MNSWERQKERNKLWNMYFLRGKNVAQIGQRRTGKTYLMGLLEKEASDKGFNAISINLETEISTEKAIAKIVQHIINNSVESIYKSFIGSVKNIFTNANNNSNDWHHLVDTPNKLIATLVKKDWKSALDYLLYEINKAEKPTLLLIDELSVCLLAILEKDRSKGSEFLHTLRALRTKYPRVIWLITGSIGLHALEKNYGLDGTNDLHIFHLEPLTKEQAKALLQHECQTRGLPKLEETYADYFVCRLGWLSPHYLLRLLDAVEELWYDTNSDICNQLIDRACQRLTRHPYNRIFTNWSNHIVRNYPDREHKQAKALLKVLCKADNGRSIDGLLSDNVTADIDETSLQNTLQLLEQDGFIVYDKARQTYDFQFGLLKDYWREYESI